MRKNQVNKILINQAKRRYTVLSFLCVIFILIFLALSLMYIYTKRNDEQYVLYNESSEIDYKVHLKENEFFEENYLEKNKQYISTLIDHITSEFKYKFELSEENIKQKYSYYVDAVVEVKDRETQNIIYTRTDRIVDYKENITTEKSTEIIKNLNINYNQYNELIKTFVSVYELNNAESTLNINMYVNIESLCEEGKKVDGKDAVITLTIPLTTQTVAIDLSNNLVNTNNNLLKCNYDEKNIMFLILSIISMLLILISTIYLLKYIANTRTAETIYERELKKILNNYGTYIQVLGNGFSFKDYQLLKLDSFTDMLEIRDTIRQPILMKENKQKTSAYFVIPGDTKILYIYRLNVSDIQKEIKK